MCHTRLDAQRLWKTVCITSNPSSKPSPPPSSPPSIFLTFTITTTHLPCHTRSSLFPNNHSSTLLCPVQALTADSHRPSIHRVRPRTQAKTLYIRLPHHPPRSMCFRSWGPRRILRRRRRRRLVRMDAGMDMDTGSRGRVRRARTMPMGGMLLTVCLPTAILALFPPWVLATATAMALETYLWPTVWVRAWGSSGSSRTQRGSRFPRHIYTWTMRGIRDGRERCRASRF